MTTPVFHPPDNICNRLFQVCFLRTLLCISACWHWILINACRPSGDCLCPAWKWTSSRKSRVQNNPFIHGDLMAEFGVVFLNLVLVNGSSIFMLFHSHNWLWIRRVVRFFVPIIIAGQLHVDPYCVSWQRKPYVAGRPSISRNVYTCPCLFSYTENRA